MNIFVAKLHFSTDNDGLRSAFEKFGSVDSAKVMMDRETGRSKCFGFVEMPNTEEAQNAIASLEGSELDGATIVVKEATAREDRPNGNKFGGGGGGFNRGGGGGGGFNRNNDRNSGGGGGFNRNNDRNSGGGGGKRW
jgi:RNA recognition motif-containing protein